MERFRKQLVFKRQIFESRDTGSNFKIYSMLDSRRKNKETIKGNLPKFKYNDSIDGFFVTTSSLKYGDQLLVKSIMDYEATDDEVKIILSYILGKSACESLYSKETVDKVVFNRVLNNKYDLLSLKGIGESTAEKIKQKVNSSVDVLMVAALLQDNMVSEKMAARILDEYTSITQVVHIVKNEPHLLSDVKGMSFKKADKISAYADVDISFERRVNLATQEILKKNSEAGSTCMTLSSFKKKLNELLSVDKVDISTLYDNEDIVVTDKFIGERYALSKEKNIANRIFNKMIEQRPFPINKEAIDNFLDDYQKKENFIFTETQKKFFSVFTENNVVALLGYAGTGKSALQKAVVELSKHAKWSVAQSAPTGRAAQVMTSYTGIKSNTLHKRFRINQTIRGEKQSPGDNQVKEKVLLVDESSMIDIVIGEYLTSGIDDLSRLVFVGDPEQLPSVGAGRFLQDLIDGGVQHVELKDVFRQSEGGILDMATNARQGKHLVPSNQKKAVKFGSDTIFHEIDREDGEKAVTYYVRLLLSKMSLDDIIVVAPKNVGMLGTESLNRLIQRQFNPRSTEKAEFKNSYTRFRVGDTILCNANTEIPDENGESIIINNGEIGKFLAVKNVTVTYKGSPKEIDALVIDFSGNIVHWPKTESHNLKLGYAITIHKMQGSSSRAIIMIADKSDTYMLNRQLVYTGLTRPQKKLVLLGDAKTINMAVKKDGSAKRNTMLGTYLKQLVQNKEKLH